MLRAPGGTCTAAAGTTWAMRPSRITTVWSGLGGAPVPSTSSTWVSATTAVSTAVYWRTSAASESGRCATSAAGASVIKIGATRAGGRMRDSSLFHREGQHHAGRQMLGDVAVQHPATGVGSVEQNIHHGAGRHQHGVLPHQIIARHAVHGEHEEPLAVHGNRMLHPVEAQSLVDQPQLHRGAPLEPPVDVHVLPACGGAAPDPPHPPPRRPPNHPPPPAAPPHPVG